MPPSKSKNRSDEHHLKKVDILDADKSLQNAFVLHMRILWGLYHATAIPPVPDAVTIASFEQNFATADQIDAFIASLSYKHKEAKARILAFRSNPEVIHSRSMITKNILAMNDLHLEVIHAGPLASGLITWAPDVLGNTDSLYNRAHELIAIGTFQTVAVGHGYACLSPNLTNLTDIPLLRKIYRNFAFSYQHKNVKAELKEAGSVEMNKLKKGIYSRCTRLCDNRSDFILSNGYSRRAYHLSMEPECHSDDEVAVPPAPPGHLRKKKIARNPNVTTFFRKLVDEPRFKVAAATGKAAQCKEERLRRDDPNDVEGSDISVRIPDDVPVDWFDPAYFNALPASFRVNYCGNGVALPLAMHLDKTDWKTMPRREFMNKYGNDVLDLYSIPTDEEMARMEENETRNLSDESSDDDDPMQQ
ncbi:hypothetical protein B0H10DRAFT_2229729 [Mycena sp. CBHHK59/15]|nr:hypothetical protein B0H10DRAFT_2229729 [Mycena sp. CBHHK59/15]